MRHAGMFLRRAPAFAETPARRGRLVGVLRYVALRAVLVMLGSVTVYGVVNPPVTWTMLGAARAQPLAARDWVPLEEIAPAMRRAVVAAEDANFCTHWGFDMGEIRRVIASGGSRGASTITQQVAKNAFLWQARSWPRKAIETLLTPQIEALWTKARILEVYLNLAEFGPGVFGIHAAAQAHFGTTPDLLTPVQSARLAAVLPNPRARGTGAASARSRAILDGAQTIARDGRAACFD